MRTARIPERSNRFWSTGHEEHTDMLAHASTTRTGRCMSDAADATLPLRLVSTRDEQRGRYGEMIARYMGPVILGALADDDVTETYVNPQDGIIRFDTRSRGRISSGAHLDSHRVEMLLNAVATHIGVTLGADYPTLEAELPAVPFRGSRLQGFVSPVTSGAAFTVRKPASIIHSLDDYVAAGIITVDQRAALRSAVVEHRNVLIVGGTNSGKTTLANALLKEITDCVPYERLVILEDTVELQCAAEDKLALRTSATVSLTHLVRSALRTSPSRIIVGEVRGAEALDLLDAWATGHPGGIATLHASSVDGALARLDRLAQRAGVPSQRHLVAEAIQLVVVIDGGNRGRHVTDIASVYGLDGASEYVIHRVGAPHTSIPGEVR